MTVFAIDQLDTLFSESGLTPSLKQTYYDSLKSSPEVEIELQNCFEGNSTTTPLIIYHERSNEFVTIFVSQNDSKWTIGEPGSILSAVRKAGFGDQLLSSDCFGQLSCSSCAVEILAGDPENPTPREEEYDMLDIDEDRPPTDKTRLSCQTLVGNSPLLVKIRA